MTDPESSGKENGARGHLLRAWFYLTPKERLAIAVILGLFLLGLGARLWHLCHETEEDRGQESEVRSQRSEASPAL